MAAFRERIAIYGKCISDFLSPRVYPCGPVLVNGDGYRSWDTGINLSWICLHGSLEPNEAIVWERSSSVLWMGVGRGLVGWRGVNQSLP